MKKILTLLLLSIIFCNAPAQFLKKLNDKVNQAIKKETKDINKLINKREDSILNKNVGGVGNGVQKQVITGTAANANNRAQALNANEEIIYSTDYNYPDNFWNEESKYSLGGQITTVVKNGSFCITNKSREFITSIIDLKIDATRNFSIETAASFTSGKDDRAFGITFGQSSGVAGKIFPFNSFVINLKGAYSLYTQKGQNEFNNIINFTESDAIKKRPDAFNKLRIEKIGAEVSLYINNVKVSNEAMFAGKPAIEFYGNYIGFYVSSQQEVSFDYFTVKYLDSKAKPNVNSAVVKNDNTPPTIQLTSPSSTNNTNSVNKAIRIQGTANDANGIYSVSINGKEAQLDDKGNFTSIIPLAVGQNVLTISALDANMNEGKYELTVNRIPENITSSRGAGVEDESDKIESTGKFYALIMGVQAYDDKKIPALDQPISDATSLYNVLTTNYLFDKENVTFLKNPKRIDMFRAFEMLQKKIGAEDNIIIFYAGHGFWDEARQQGYWFPSDAGSADRSSWISNADLKDNIVAINSKHTLLITDACFAGGIFKGRSLAGATKAINELYNTPSRSAMTSGTLKEVPDKSVFIEELVKHLKANKEKYLAAQQLFSSFSQVVTNNSPNAQVPQYGVIREAKDAGGEFIFIKR